MSLGNGFVADRDARVERAEALLRSLTGVVAARIQVGPHGEIRDIHVVISHDTDPSQAARNAQSALLARLGIHADHRTISISAAPLATGNGHKHDPIIAPAAPEHPDETHPLLAPHAPAMADYRLRLDSIELERRLPHRLRCRVTITCADRIATGEAEGLDAPGNNLELAARAAADAVRSTALNPAGALEIDGVRQIELAGNEYIMVAARAHLGRSIRYLAGIAAVEDLPEDAAALASLQAIERWLNEHGHPMAHHPK